MIKVKKIDKRRLGVALVMWAYAILVAREWFAVFLTLPTALIIFWKISSIRETYFTAWDMLLLCMMIFFVMGPCQSIENMGFQRVSDVGFEGRGVSYTLYDFWAAELIIISSLLSFIWGESFGKAVGDNRNKLVDFQGIWSNRRFLILLALVSFVFGVVATGGIANVLASRPDKDTDSSILSVLFLAIQIVSAVCVVILMQNSQGWKGIYLRGMCLIILVCLFITVNPFNSPRFVILAAWLPVIIAYVHDRVSLNVYYGAFIGGLLLIMPILRATSTAGFNILSESDFSEYFQDIMVLKFVDVFDTLVHCINFMSARDFYYGDNVMAILFFFVPRAYWPDKPRVGGLIIGDDLYFLKIHGTNNLSFFPGGDLYMDFGFIGVILGFFIIGFLFAKFLSGQYLVFGRRIKDLIMIGSLPILIRGPIGATVGYFACLLVAYYIVSFSTLRKAREMQRVSAPAI